MAKKCSICGKGSIMVQRLTKLRGKYNPTIKKRKYPNLQWMKLTCLPAGRASGKPASPVGKRVLACAKCIKAAAKNK